MALCLSSKSAGRHPKASKKARDVWAALCLSTQRCSMKFSFTVDAVNGNPQLRSYLSLRTVGQTPVDSAFLLPASV